MVAAWLTSERPGSVIPVSKTLALLGGHSVNVQFLNLTQNVWSCCAVLLLVPARPFTPANNKELIKEAMEQSKEREPGDGLSPTIPAERLEEVSGEFLPGVYAIPLPGHTDNLHGIAFSSEGKNILMAADAVMTRYHFRDKITEFQTDPEKQKIAASTIENISKSFDIIIPGHDNLVII